jgi:hypothetical protein
VKIVIEDWYDGFVIRLGADEENPEFRVHIDQEDDRKSLVDLFKHLGFDDVEYVEAC